MSEVDKHVIVGVKLWAEENMMNRPLTVHTMIRVGKLGLHFYKQIYDGARRDGLTVHECREAASASWKKIIHDAGCAHSYTLGLDGAIRQRVLRVCVKRLGWEYIDNTVRPKASS